MKLLEAAKRAATDGSSAVTVVAFSVTMCVLASNLKDGSEAKTILVAGVLTFFGNAWRQLSKDKGES